MKQYFTITSQGDHPELQLYRTFPILMTDRINQGKRTLSRTSRLVGRKNRFECNGADLICLSRVLKMYWAGP